MHFPLDQLNTTQNILHHHDYMYNETNHNICNWCRCRIDCGRILPSIEQWPSHQSPIGQCNLQIVVWQMLNNTGRQQQEGMGK
jgi:hypothetical protein